MNKVLVIVGPTASGKSSLALKAALELDGEIVSADSMQIYREMDIGTAKPTAAEQAAVRHHMIDIVNPNDAYSAGKYQVQARAVIDDVLKRRRVPIICGGTGLYVNALTHALDFSSIPESSKAVRQELLSLPPGAAYAELEALAPEAAKRVHPNNLRRVIRALEIARLGSKAYDFDRKSMRYEFLILGLNPPREQLYQLIDCRVDGMISRGLVTEVERLTKHYGSQINAMQAIGYKEFRAYFEGVASLEEAVTTIKQNSRHLAKRQLTWFRRDNRIIWLDSPNDSKVSELFRTVRNPERS